MNLYWVADEGLDLMVRATDVEDAKDIWRQYYERLAEEEPEEVRLLVLPEGRGAISWT